jgi:hypothetical protein
VDDISNAIAFPDCARDVGELAPLNLLALAGRLHHLCVEADAAGHGEYLALAAHPQSAEVDLAARAAHQDLGGPVGGIRDSKVAGQQIAHPHGDDPEGDLPPCEGLHDLEHHSIAADRDDHVRGDDRANVTHHLHHHDHCHQWDPGPQDDRNADRRLARRLTIADLLAPPTSPPGEGTARVLIGGLWDQRLIVGQELVPALPLEPDVPARHCP